MLPPFNTTSSFVLAFCLSSVCRKAVLINKTRGEEKLFLMVHWVTIYKASSDIWKLSLVIKEKQEVKITQKVQIVSGGFAYFVSRLRQKAIFSFKLTTYFTEPSNPQPLKSKWRMSSLKLRLNLILLLQISLSTSSTIIQKAVTLLRWRFWVQISA